MHSGVQIGVLGLCDVLLHIPDSTQETSYWPKKTHNSPLQIPHTRSCCRMGPAIQGPCSFLQSLTIRVSKSVIIRTPVRITPPMIGRPISHPTSMTLAQSGWSSESSVKLRIVCGSSRLPPITDMTVFQLFHLLYLVAEDEKVGLRSLKRPDMTRALAMMSGSGRGPPSYPERR